MTQNKAICRTFKNSLIGSSKKYLFITKSLISALRGVWLLGAGFCIGLWTLASCASMQSPSGGPKDAEAPKVQKEKPKNLSTSFLASEIELTFNEFIKLNNAFTEITISPSLEKPLDIKASKEVLTIKLGQTLEPNTTYTINFGKAIGDENENNLLKNYNYVFSSGTVLDSLSIGGKVTSATTNEALKDVMVFLFPTKQDSLLGKKKPSTYTLTDEAGNYKLNNLRVDEYSVYALKEASTDKIYNQGEDEIGFSSTKIKLGKNTSGVNLRVFKELPQDFKVLEKRVELDGKLLLILNKPTKELSVKELGGTNYLKNSIKKYSNLGDSVLIWTQELAYDSLKLGIYSGEESISIVDINRNKGEASNRTPVIKDNTVGNKLKPGLSYSLLFSMPSELVDSTKISLQSDSVKLSGWKVGKTSGLVHSLGMSYPFKAGKNYTVKVAAGAFSGISGLKNNAYSKTFTQDGLDSYGNLSLILTPADSTKTYIIQLLNEQKVVLKEDVITRVSTLTYKTYPIGKYSIRVVLDENKNGKWDSGDVAKNLQPEKVWWFDKTIGLRANWDLEERITIPADF
jgi:phenylpyruvate tautomerase PptA (4-oxalocrotonate tautomerase family)